MRVVIAAVGRLKKGPERDLAERYRKRAADTGRNAGLPIFDVIEIRESRADSSERRMIEESIAIANVIPERAVTVVLEGLAASLREKTDLALAFGAATWPHQLVRIMLLEQLYRAVTILSGHPYHRGA